MAQPTAGGGFSITHTFHMPSKNGPTRLRICFPAYHFRFRGCAELAVTIERSSKRTGQLAHEKRRHQPEAARKHRAEERQRRDREREERRKLHEEAHRRHLEKGQ
jgi:hypothetical protein